MIALLQRVTEARVAVQDEVVAAIGRGLLVLVGMEACDGEAEAARLAERLLGYRVFPDAAGRMNLSVRDIAGELLIVPQFTLAADTSTGARPSFSPAATPALARSLFERLVAHARSVHASTQAGRFGQDMKVSLTNDGPVTFSLRVAPGRAISR